MRGLAVATVIGGLSVASTPAAAQGAWCSEDMISRNCGFYTLAQCQAHASGLGGYCSPNPFAPGGSAAPAKQHPRRARSR